jgi:hypothetical protein
MGLVPSFDSHWLGVARSDLCLFVLLIVVFGGSFLSIGNNIICHGRPSYFNACGSHDAFQGVTSLGVMIRNLGRMKIDRKQRNPLEGEEKSRVLVSKKHLPYEETWSWPTRILCSAMQIRKSSNSRWLRFPAIHASVPLFPGQAYDCQESR